MGQLLYMLIQIHSHQISFHLQFYQGYLRIAQQCSLQYPYQQLFHRMG